MDNAVVDPLAVFYRWTCPRCKEEIRFWGRKPIPDYCPACGTEPGREARQMNEARSRPNWKALAIILVAWVLALIFLCEGR